MGPPDLHTLKNFSEADRKWDPRLTYLAKRFRSDSEVGPPDFHTLQNLSEVNRKWGPQTYIPYKTF